MLFRSKEEEWEDLRVEFCRMDLTALRSQTVAVCIPPSGLERTEQVEGSGALLLSFPVLVDGEPCGLRFSSVVGVVRHGRVGHKLVHWGSSLVVANMCSWCASFFITKKDAESHVMGAVVSGVCHVDR